MWTKQNVFCTLPFVPETNRQKVKLKWVKSENGLQEIINPQDVLWGYEYGSLEKTNKQTNKTDQK